MSFLSVLQTGWRPLLKCCANENVKLINVLLCETMKCVLIHSKEYFMQDKYTDLQFYTAYYECMPNEPLKVSIF